MEFTLGFGSCTQKLNVPDENLICVLMPNTVQQGLTGEAEVSRALNNPIGTPRIGQIVHPGREIEIDPVADARAHQGFALGQGGGQGVFGQTAG